MKQQVINQEILLFANTKFFSRSFYIKEACNEAEPFCFSLETLEKACWAGVLPEILPELIIQPSSDNKNYLWQTMIGAQSLRAILGSHPQPIENVGSIDPNFFLPTKNNN